MQNDPGTEWQRLARLYADKSDEELVDLSEDFGNLTEVAQQALRDELRKRKLSAPAVAPAMTPDNRPGFAGWNRGADQVNTPSREADGEASEDQPRDYSWRTQLCQCDSNEQANLLHMTLLNAGIESWVDFPDPEQKLGLDLPRIFVPADQLQQARQIAAQPIPQEIMEESNAAFVAPRCPKCGATDPLLESVDSANHWLCESCGAEWTDAQPAQP